MRYFLFGLLFLSIFPTRSAEAHLANFGSWEVTREYLGELFPGATEFKAKRYSFDDAQVKKIESELGFELYPEDRNPTFYVARREDAGGSKFLGVAVFIDPRLEPRALGGAVLRLECGIAVGPSGAISKVAVFDYRGDLALTRDKFLSQFEGKTLESNFQVGESVSAIPGEEESSQLVANAAYEALYLMKVALGQGARESASPKDKTSPSCSTTGRSSPGWLLVFSILAGCAGGVRRASRVRSESPVRSKS